jgi:hypothetical protein
VGQAKAKQHRREEFLKRHPLCCYCGAVATTTDHCPPRSLFEQRHWPEGYEFPACEPCNSEGRLSEIVIACLYRMRVLRLDNYSGETRKLLQGLRNNRRDIVEEWLGSTSAWREAKLREGFGPLGAEMQRRGYGVAQIGGKTHEVINYFGQKLSKALYYKHIERRLRGRLFCKSVSLSTESELMKVSLEFAPGVPLIERSSKDLSGQFIYRYNFNVEYGVFCAVVGFGEQFGYIMFAMEQDFYDQALREHPDLGTRLDDAFPQAPARATP